MSSRGFSLDEIQWLPVDRTRLWSPSEIAPLTYLPSFQNLSETAKVRYNQLFALGVCEQFIWFEEDLLSRVLEAVLASGSSTPAMKSDLEEFLEDEKKHSEMFWRLLEHAEPVAYAKRNYRFLSLKPWQSLAISAMVKFPNVFFVWIWAATFFEERTLDYSRRYRNLKLKSPERIDETFATCHLLHLQDEAKHHSIDEQLVDTVYRNAPVWKRNLASKMMFLLMKAFTSPRNVSKRILKMMQIEFPNEAALLKQLEYELPLLAKSSAFRETAFGEKSVSATRRLLKEFPEMKAVRHLFGIQNS